jgi:predicted DsbA family dithiol-disulfide isomerase
MHDRLFQLQDVLDVSQLPAVAKQIGLDASTFAACMQARLPIIDIEADYNVAVDELRARGTPTFVINGFVVSGFVPLETFEKIIAEQQK